MREVKIGAPGFILIRDMAEDMPGTLKKISALGYDGIELLGFFGHSAAEIREWCKESGLTPYSCFITSELLTCSSYPDNPLFCRDYAQYDTMPGSTPGDRVSEFIREIGCEYVSLSVPDQPADDDFIEQLREAARVLRAHGLKPQYHNHDFEYTNMRSRQYRMDRILESTDLLFEPDLGWMEIAGYRCEEAIRRYASRIDIIHLKDFTWNDDEHVFRPTGYGVMDWARILPLCEELAKPVWYTADHDCAYDRDIYEELGMSLDFIKNALKFCS